MKKSKIFKLYLQKGIFCSFAALLLMLGFVTEKPTTEAEDNEQTTITVYKDNSPIKDSSEYN